LLGLLHHHKLNQLKLIHPKILPSTQNIPNPTSQPTGQQVPPNRLVVIIGIVNSLFKGVNRQQTGNVPPQITIAFGNLGCLNANNSLGDLGMRIKTKN
jgi:hypothetical protein